MTKLQISPHVTFIDISFPPPSLPPSISISIKISRAIAPGEITTGTAAAFQEPSQSRYVEAAGTTGAGQQGISTLTRQGLEVVELLREAERQGFTTDDVQVALAQGASSPIEWLRTQWPHLVETVQVLVTAQGKELKENSIGALSAAEAREALRSAKGDVWNAVAAAVRRRYQKVRICRGESFRRTNFGLKLRVKLRERCSTRPSRFRQCERIMTKGNFALPDVVGALDNNAGAEEAALLELQKNQLKPFLMRIWGPPVGVENDGAAPHEGR